MKTLKLEVGKTYRNRKGEEVRIVRKNDKSRYPYQNNDGLSYTESGRFYLNLEESEQDLIEEVPEPRHTFEILGGAKYVIVERVGNRIIVEMVPDIKEPKPGDVSRSANTDAMQMSEQNIIMTELETKIWNTVHNWCDEQSSEIPDQNRRYLMDEIKTLVLLHVSGSLPSDEEFETALEKEAFRVPYDGSNNFYNEPTLKHWRKCWEWVKNYVSNDH